MSNFTALLSEVYIKTARSDLVDDTKNAVKAATLKAHLYDDFSRDLFETGIQFNAADYQLQFHFQSLFPRWRKDKYFRKADSVGTPGVFLTRQSIDKTLDQFGITNEDVYYLAGSVINIRSSTPLQYLLVGCYLLPDITETNYTSWIADLYPYAIVYEAAALVFKSIGQDEESVKFETLITQEKESLIRAEINELGT